MTRNPLAPLAPISLALALAAAGPAAAVDPALGARLGSDLDAVAAALAESGWELTKFEREGPRLEVYAVKDATRAEMRLDPATGAVTALETESRRGDGPRHPEADDALRARLAADGYAVTTFERERGRIEVYATRDGARWEIEADARTGEILTIEREDD